MSRNELWVATILAMAIFAPASMAQDSRQPLVLCSDFGTTERFVASMKGVAMSVDPKLLICTQY